MILLSDKLNVKNKYFVFFFEIRNTDYIHLLQQIRYTSCINCQTNQIFYNFCNFRIMKCNENKNEKKEKTLISTGKIIF